VLDATEGRGGDVSSRTQLFESIWSGPASEDTTSPTTVGFFEQAKRPKTPAELEEQASVAKRLDYDSETASSQGQPQAGEAVKTLADTPTMGSLGSFPLADTPGGTPRQLEDNRVLSSKVGLFAND
jgi:hypothetical protein